MKSLFSIFKNGLQKTATSLVRGVQSVFTETKPWTAEDFEHLEGLLIQADLGVVTAAELVNDLKERYDRGKIATREDIRRAMAEDVTKILEVAGAGNPFTPAAKPPTVVLLVGVNGTGKTTTAAKLAHLWQQDGLKVMLAACDTFRAAAVEQLVHWGARVNCPVVAGKPNSDPAAVAFDAATRARNEGMDILLVDTAGRQHTRKALMDELGKIARTIAKACPGAPHEVWLTVDAGIGTNAVTQAREFSKIVPLTGLIITKLDGTGRGGSLVPICRELRIPVRFAGLGERETDLQPFRPDFFAQALFEVKVTGSP